MVGKDRIGIAWRPDAAAALLPRLDRIDVLEAMIEDVAGADRAERDALAALAREVPTTLHGTGLGLASHEPLDARRLDAVARAVNAIRPIAWSEHLAFVRSGGMEMGHLTAPPRDARTLDAVARNVARAARVVGAAPFLENVATLVEPPGSDRSESAWLRDVLIATGGKLLLDLHNLHANAVNFGFDAVACMDLLPRDRVAEVHAAGGSEIRRGVARRLLDDHRHPTPDAVFALAEEAGRRFAGPLIAIVERDGAFPPVEELLAEADRLRVALRAGRERPISRPEDAATAVAALPSRTPVDLNGWARVLRDPETRERFLRDPSIEGPLLGLGRGPFDLEGVVLAAASLESKRTSAPHAR